MFVMDILKAEIERKRKQMENSQVLVPDKKYFKRGDLAAKLEEDYWRRHNRLIGETANTSNEVVDDTNVEASSSQSEDMTTLIKLPRTEVVRRLRERDEPVRVFAESDYDSYQRLKRLESLAPEINKGFKNDFKAAMDKVDQDYLNEIIQLQSGVVQSSEVKDDGMTRDDIPTMYAELGTGDSDKDQLIMWTFLKYILTLWGKSLGQRDESARRSMQGKLESATHGQTVGYLKPLFRKLKQKKIDTDILDSLVEIIKYLMDRNYIKANDSYLEMAIGNAPWPIGVTMVGIHARTGREKISSRYLAHVLNDETQRKYIQALKRLMTQCQRFFPTDPIRSVNYERPNPADANFT